MNEDKRVHKRFFLSRLSVFDLDKDKYLNAKGVDISEGGIGFLSKDYISQKDAIWLSFVFPTAEGCDVQMETEGHIVDVVDTPEGCRFGVSFSRMAEEDKKVLKFYLDRCNSESIPRDKIALDYSINE